MTDLVWLLPWLVAGIPVPSMVTKLRLLRKSRRDYAYYIMAKELSFPKAFAFKVSFFLAFGLVFVLRAVPDFGMLPTIAALGLTASLLESGLVVDRPHPTRGYVRSKFVCPECRGFRHDDCTNLRMMDSFETGFRSKDGRYRPICCCGRRISNWREISV